MQSLNEQIIIWAPKLGMAAAVFFLFYLIAKAGKTVVLKLEAKGRLDSATVSLLSRFVFVSVMILGGITALGTL
ncbi:MAG: hypothetical protein IID18_05925 [Nitrospinae bacterium]|nr:hypothetical protein [Nitrospinota bacterium]